MRNLLCVVAVIACSVATPQFISACSCVILSPLESLKQADFVFSGAVIEIEEQGAFEDDFLFLTKFQIDRSWKGVDEEEVAILSWGPHFGSNCGYTFEVGEDYLVYGYIGNTIGARIGTDSSPDEVEIFRVTNTCWQPKPLSEATEDIEALDNPTDISVVEPSLWGQIKALFESL